ncbi:MAG: hypothetical protein CVT96_04755 [Bacteroidetes bacterium HGW-Bacteroidetes-13]|nr:MAG: hypothetical protein CVT96_04755 [Bacteroidetes bacterium HGW-Bacteroidetes-13]
MKTYFKIFISSLLPAIISLYFLFGPNLISNYFPQETKQLSLTPLNEEENKTSNLKSSFSEEIKHLSDTHFLFDIFHSEALYANELAYVHNPINSAFTDIDGPPPKI